MTFPAGGCFQQKTNLQHKKKNFTWQEEVFGPVLVVKTFSTEEQVFMYLFYHTEYVPNVTVVKTLSTEEEVFVSSFFYISRNSPPKSRHYIVYSTVTLFSSLYMVKVTIYI